MSMDGPPDTLVPARLIPEVMATAAAEQRSPDELVGEALDSYLKNRRWRQLLERSQARAKALGLTEDDLPRLIAEARQEQRADR